ncbi:hypothetical protein BH11PSE11_BH11PSE11_04830 [soil metagenome]
MSPTHRRQSFKPAAAGSILRNFAVILFLLGAAIFPGLSLAEATSPEWRKDEICGKPLLAFEPARLNACVNEAYCSAVGKDTRLCACQNPGQPESANTTLMLEYKGEIRKKWTTDIFPMSYGPASFRVDEFGLDQDGKKLFLFAVMSAQSNGMGVQYWTIWPLREAEIFAPVEMQDYGVMGFATRTKGGQQCRLLVSRWENGGKDGTGRYIVGRWHNLVDGKLMPAADRLAISSRYLYRLEKQMFASMSANRPLRWFASKDAAPIR